MSKWIFNIGILIAILIGGYLGYKIAFPEKNIKKPDSALIDNGDPDILGVNPKDIEFSKSLSDEYAFKIAKALANFLSIKKDELNERTCVGILTDLNKDGNYDGYFMDKYTIEDIAPSQLIIRYNGCSFLWYKNKKIILTITTQKLLNNDVQDVGIKYVPSFVYIFNVNKNQQKNKIQVTLEKKEQGMVPIDKYLLP